MTDADAVIPVLPPTLLRIATSTTRDYSKFANEFFNAPIHTAILHNDLETVRQHLDSHRRRFDISVVSLAVLCRNFEIVDFLVSSGEQVQRYADNAVACAAYVGDLPILKRLVAASVDFTLRDRNDRSVFDIAAARGHADALAFLFENAPTDAVSFCGYKRHTVIRYAAMCPNADVLGLVLRVLDASQLNEVARARVQADLRTVAVVAARNPNVAIMRMLIDRGCEINFVDRDVGGPCHMAAANLNPAMIALLFATPNFQADLKDSSGRTIAHYAAKNPNPAVMEIVRRSGVVPIDHADMFGKTPIWIALPHESNVALLLAAGANCNEIDGSGRSLCAVAADGGHDGALRLLIDAGANVHHRDRFERTLCHFAAKSGKAAIVARVLAAGTDVNARDKDGVTPLGVALSSWAPDDVVKLLVSAGADVNARNESGMPLCCSAVVSGHTSMAALLLDAGANARDADSYGMTLLHRAAASNAALVRKVIRCGADVHARDCRGQTAAHCIMWHSHEQVLAPLFAAGLDLSATDGNNKTVFMKMHATIATCAAAGANMGLLRSTSVSDESHALLIASGWVEPSDEPARFDIAAAERVLLGQQMILLGLRGAEVCIGLQALDLPALVTCTMLEFVFAPMVNLVPFHRLWAIATKTKHFTARHLTATV
jgi:ankyrin repeat protein